MRCDSGARRPAGETIEPAASRQTESRFAQGSRRDFLAFAASLALSAGVSHVFALGGAPTTDQTNAELDIAALGEWLRRAEPGTATALEADARKAAGLSPYAAVTWPIARATRVQLTAPDRIATEFAQADVVFVDGWPLARSEAAAALLYATASNSPQLQPSIHGSEALP